MYPRDDEFLAQTHENIFDIVDAALPTMVKIVQSGSHDKEIEEAAFQIKDARRDNRSRNTR